MNKIQMYLIIAVIIMGISTLITVYGTFVVGTAMPMYWILWMLVISLTVSGLSFMKARDLKRQRNNAARTS
jgi:hypothetical protein